MEEKTPHIVGHAARWDALRRAFASHRVPHSLLISGPAHTGKWTLTRLWAQLLLCPHARENLVGGLPTPCLKCRTCHQVEVETFPDFFVLRPVVNATTPRAAPEALDSSIILLKSDDKSVRTARKFVSEARYKPTAGQYKVMVMYQADRMAEESQNALLKTIEEPNVGVHIILVTDKPSDLLPTIRSRCWNLQLGLAASRAISEWLGESFPSLPAPLLARAVASSGGRPGLAWRQAGMLCENPTRSSRAEQVRELIERVCSAEPWGFLALSESAQKLAEQWGEEDAIARTGDEIGSDDKKLARTLVRSQLARFLDELAQGYRARWIEDLAASNSEDKAADASAWTLGLDRIGKTRHYILRNANAPLALDVLFSDLVQAHQQTHRQRPRQRPHQTSQTVSDRRVQAGSKVS